MRRIAIPWLLLAGAWSQSPPPAEVAADLQRPAVAFRFENPQVNPTQFELTIDALGRASYRSRASEALTPYYGQVEKEFTVSPATKERIFALAREAHYFAGDFQFRKHKVAFSGERTLTYLGDKGVTSTTFTYTENPALQQLSSLLEGISNTLEVEPRLRHLRRFDRLGLNEQLARLERLAQGGWLREPQLLVPVLQELADDGSVMNIARQRARRLLAVALTPAGPRREQ
jgi:tRNA(Leu) C34 or U34 (ribose-2'-O)-methylase TrmL